MQALEDSEGNDATNADAKIYIQGEESELERERARTTEDQNQIFGPRSEVEYMIVAGMVKIAFYRNAPALEGISEGNLTDAQQV